MTQDEYKKKCEDLKKEYLAKRNELSKEYVETYPGKFQIGDFIKNPYTGEIIKIEQIKTALSYNSEFPQPYYGGARLTAKKVPFKSGEKTGIHHGNAIKFE